jgi:hypothetical protein
MDEKLYNELIAECDRLTEAINQMETGSDEWKQVYGRKLDVLEKMQEYNKVDAEYYDKMENRRITEEHNSKMVEIEIEKMREHKEIERERNAATIQAEEEKQKLSWKRVIFEMAKLVVPVGISSAIYLHAQNKVFDFEEHGRITSTAGRELHLPKIFTK